MAFKKKETSAAVEQAKLRLNGMKKIDTEKNIIVDYGAIDRKLTAVEYENQINAVEKQREEYNGILKEADTANTILETEEVKLGKMSTEILSSGRGKFGADSIEYEQLGGTRSSDRKKGNRKSINGVPTPQ